MKDMGAKEKKKKVKVQTSILDIIYSTLTLTDITIFCTTYFLLLTLAVTLIETNKFTKSATSTRQHITRAL